MWCGVVCVWCGVCVCVCGVCVCGVCVHVCVVCVCAYVRVCVHVRVHVLQSVLVQQLQKIVVSSHWPSDGYQCHPPPYPPGVQSVRSTADGQGSRGVSLLEHCICHLHW